MGLHNGCWAKVWEVKPGEKNTILRVSISRKDKNTGNYVDDFTGYLKLVGEAQKMSGELLVADRIKIGSCDVSTRYEKDTKKTYVNYTIFSIDEIHHKKDRDADQASNDTNADVLAETDDEGELPF